MTDNKEKMLSEQIKAYPSTRFMGSKRKLLSDIWEATIDYDFDSVVDLFSGSGTVGYMYKCQGKKVISNDYMSMSATIAKAMVENNNTTLSMEETMQLLVPCGKNDGFVEKTFKGLYYSDEDNRLIDIIRSNIWEMNDEYKRSIAMAALIRACLKKRARGIFAYTGFKYDDGRRDLRISMKQQFIEAVEAINGAVFDNKKNNIAICGDALELKVKKPDLVYIDPPYYSPHSDNEYVRRYHFVEGLARDWKDVEIQENTKTKKFKSYQTPFSTKNGAAEAFDNIFKKYKNSILVVSYSSNSLPTQDEMIDLIGRYKEDVRAIPVNYTYGFGNQRTAKTHRNKVQEFIFVGV